MIEDDAGAFDADLSGPGAFAIDVVGESRYQPALEAAAAGGAIVRAMLVLEDSNPYDDRAVQVRVGGQVCGYLSRDNARRYRAALAAAGEPRASVRCNAKITGGFEIEGGRRAHFGLKLDLPPLPVA